MSCAALHCALLAESHPGLVERIRGLLATRFDVVATVADETSLLTSAECIRPMLAVADLSLCAEGNLLWVQRLRNRCPEVKLILLSVHDTPELRRAALAAGADGWIPKRSLASDLIPTVDSLLRPDIWQDPVGDEPRAHPKEPDS